MAHTQYNVPGQTNLATVNTFFLGKPAPIVAERIWDTKAHAQSYIDDTVGSALAGIILRVTDDTTNNGAYLVEKDITATNGLKLSKFITGTDSNTWRNIKVKTSASGTATEILGTSSTLPLTLTADSNITLTAVQDSNNEYTGEIKISASGGGNDTWRNIYSGGTSRVGTGTDSKAINFADGTNTTVSYEAAGTGTGQSGSTDYFNIKINATDTDTWRNIYTGGTSRVGSGTDSKAINFAAGSNVTVSYEAAGTGTGQSGSTDYFNIKIAADNDNTWRNIYVNDALTINSGTDTKAINYKAGDGITISYEAAGTGTGQSGDLKYFNIKTTLNVAGNNTLGGIKLGYTNTGRNMAVETDSDKAYVNTHTTNMNTVYIAGTNVTLSTPTTTDYILTSTDVYNDADSSMFKVQLTPTVTTFNNDTIIKVRFPSNVISSKRLVFYTGTNASNNLVSCYNNDMYSTSTKWFYPSSNILHSDMYYYFIRKSSPNGFIYLGTNVESIAVSGGSTYKFTLNGSTYGDSTSGTNLSGANSDGIFAPSTAGTANQILISGGANTAPSWDTLGIETYSSGSGAKSQVRLNIGSNNTSWVPVRMAASSSHSGTESAISGETLINEILFFQGSNITLKKVVDGNREGLQINATGGGGSANDSTITLRGGNSTTYSTWSDNFTTNTSSDKTIYVPVMTGATSGANGEMGLVPTPASADREKYLRGDGTWQTVSGGSTDSFKTIAVSGQSSVVADSSTDTLTLVAGTGMTITTNASTDTITFASSGGGGGIEGMRAYSVIPSTFVQCTPMQFVLRLLDPIVKDYVSNDVTVLTDNIKAYEGTGGIDGHIAVGSIILLYAAYLYSKHLTSGRLVWDTPGMGDYYNYIVCNGGSNLYESSDPNYGDEQALNDNSVTLFTFNWDGYGVTSLPNGINDWVTTHGGRADTYNLNFTSKTVYDDNYDTVNVVGASPTPNITVPMLGGNANNYITHRYTFHISDIEADNGIDALSNIISVLRGSGPSDAYDELKANDIFQTKTIFFRKMVVSLDHRSCLTGEGANIFYGKPS